MHSRTIRHKLCSVGGCMAVMSEAKRGGANCFFLESVSRSSRFYHSTCSTLLCSEKWGSTPYYEKCGGGAHHTMKSGGSTPYYEKWGSTPYYEKWGSTPYYEKWGSTPYYEKWGEHTILCHHLLSKMGPPPHSDITVWGFICWWKMWIITNI